MKNHANNIITLYDIATGLLCFAGMLPGLLCYNRLPDTMPIHFDIHNQPDNYASKPFLIFGMPLLMLVFHLICCAADNLMSNGEATPRPVHVIVRLIMPVMTIVLEAITVLFVLDTFTDIGMVCCLIVSLLFILLGNYLPKTRPNLAFGIKLPWTVNNEQVWRKTHRLGGWLMVVGGVGMMAASFLQWYIVVILIALAVILIPTVYSFVIGRQAQ